MKLKLIIPLLLLSMTIACKKSYTCTCTGGWSHQTYDEAIKAKSKEEAKTKCEVKNTTQSDTYNCHLK